MEDEHDMRIGVLTGGGDCPGLNAVIRAVVRKGVTTYGHEFVGFRDGWRGPLEGQTMPQVSSLLEIPLGTATSRLRRAREAFRAAVAAFEASIPGGTKS